MKKLFALLFFIPSAAVAGGAATGGATFPEQIVQEVTLIQQKVTQAQQLVQQMNMVENQLKNLQQLPQNYWNSAQNYLDQIIQLVGTANGLALNAQNITQQFQQEYPQWDKGNQFLSNYNHWYTTTNTQIANALAVNGYQASQFASEQSALAQVEAASQSSQGRLQAIQAGNQISGMVVNQLQKLRALLISENQSEQAYKAQQINTQQAKIQARADYTIPNVTFVDNVPPPKPGVP